MKKPKWLSRENIKMIIEILTFILLLYTFTTDNFIKRGVVRQYNRFFAPTINLEQNISPEAAKELRKNSPDGTIRIEKGITIREEPNAEDQRW